MTIEEQLKQEILSKYKSVRAFTTTINVPYSTLDSALKRGVENAGIATMLKVFGALDLDIESIRDGTLRHRDCAVKEFSAIAEQSIIQKYRALDTYGQDTVLAVLDCEHKRCTEQQTDTEIGLAARKSDKPHHSTGPDTEVEI